MTDLTAKADLLAGTTEAQFQAAVGAMWEVIAQNLGNSGAETCIIDNGVITPVSKTYLFVDTEGAAATDNLDRIAPAGIGEKLILLRMTSVSRKTTIRHLQTGTGQIYLRGGASALFDHQDQVMILRYNPTLTRWEELWRNWGVFLPTTANKSAARTEMGLGTASTVNTGTASGAVPLNSDLGALSKKNTIDSASLVNDGILTGAKFGDSTIALAKLANSTANSIVAFNASGVPVTITPTASGQVLNFTGGNLNFAAPANNSGPWGQADLKTATGTFGGVPLLQTWSTGAGVTPPTAPIYVGSTKIVLPSGQYGFWMENYTNGPVNGFWSYNDTNTYSAAVVPWSINNTSGFSTNGRQRYITASPPYDLGDGETAGFIYLLLEDGKPIASYFAETPPWINNGPTNLTPVHIDRVYNKKYCELKRQRTVEEILEGAPVEYDVHLITPKIQNLDMNLIPHPFSKLQPNQEVVLIDPMSDFVRNLVIAQDDGEDIMGLIMSGRLKPDNTQLKRKGPKGIPIHGLKFD